MNQRFTSVGVELKGHVEAIFDVPVCREFTQLQEFSSDPDESTLLRFRHQLEKHKLADQILTTFN